METTIIFMFRVDLQLVISRLCEFLIVGEVWYLKVKTYKQTTKLLDGTALLEENELMLPFLFTISKLNL